MGDEIEDAAMRLHHECHSGYQAISSVRRTPEQWWAAERDRIKDLWRDIARKQIFEDKAAE